MSAYIIRRLFLIVPTLFLIVLINFAIVQFAPGGPVEQAIAEIEGLSTSATARLGGGVQQAEQGTLPVARGSDSESSYRGSRGLDPEIIAEIEKRFGFDKPAHERFWMMLRDYLTFNFGESYYQDRKVVDLVLEKMPVSISLGLWTMLITYLVSIPLGIAKAVRDGTPFDVWTSGIVIIGAAIPSFLFAVLLIVLFAGGRYLDWFPLRDLVSDNWDMMSWPERIVDYFWHLALPITAMVIGGFAGLTMLTKNSFLDQINMQYVVTARAKGLTERRVLYGHVFRNGMLIVIAGFPAAFIGILFTGALLIEIIFSLDGLGRLGWEAVINRDYPVMFASLYFFTLLGLVMGIVNDVMYMLIDPRIDFEAQGDR
ncbi:microcin C ABC transporter permease YejB [Aestuariispira insulae]|uniref:Microcin C transport system permease protein n=1 Tax=Aestuariispira insulae TaxID=1461337 RepID=A0A3D9HZC5_9PROT|nr:microcin C ABC transporter permease YejB [Aestuariispira insulae]RED54256.1 microcin C transport system permease protein [Aestuariispira insulae]